MTAETKIAAQFFNWETIPFEKIAEGIERQLIVGEKLMICRLRFAPLTVTPEHDHPHEQMTIIERGKVNFIVDGAEKTAVAGDVLHFPPLCRHGATMLEEEVVLIDIFRRFVKIFCGNNFCGVNFRSSLL